MRRDDAEGIPPPPNSSSPPTHVPLAAAIDAGVMVAEDDAGDGDDANAAACAALESNGEEEWARGSRSTSARAEADETSPADVFGRDSPPPVPLGL